MRSPTYLGTTLTVISLVALVVPLIALAVLLLNLDVMNKHTYRQSSFQAVTSLVPILKKVVPSQIPSTMESILPTTSFANLLSLDDQRDEPSFTSLIHTSLQLIARSIYNLPQIVASGMLCYVGICVGYVGLVYLRVIDPDAEVVSVEKRRP